MKKSSSSTSEKRRSTEDLKRSENKPKKNLDSDSKRKYLIKIKKNNRVVILVSTYMLDLISDQVFLCKDCKISC